MNLINSKTVSSSEDIFWNDIPGKWEVLAPRPVLVLAAPYKTAGLEEETLIKMLSGCALTQDKYHILQIENGEQVAWHMLRDKLDPQQVILLGVEPGQLGISALFRFNEMNRFNDRTFIPSLSLQQMQQYPEAKKALWVQALKPCFLPSA